MLFLELEVLQHLQFTNIFKNVDMYMFIHL